MMVVVLILYYKNYNKPTEQRAELHNLLVYKHHIKDLYNIVLYCIKYSDRITYKLSDLIHKICTKKITMQFFKTFQRECKADCILFKWGFGEWKTMRIIRNSVT